jgi:hypothetical protein
MADQDTLKMELETYEKHKERLIAESDGRFVVIRGENILGVYDTYEDALEAGYEKAGLNQFLVKKIQRVDQVHFFTRDIVLSCQS